MSNETYVYVVTHSPLGKEQGQFFREEAWESVSDARAAAFECMDEYGGRASYVASDRGRDCLHVVIAWDWQGPPDTVDIARTVWLERLVLVSGPKASV